MCSSKNTNFDLWSLAQLYLMDVNFIQNFGCFMSSLQKILLDIQYVGNRISVLILVLFGLMS